MRWGLLSTFVVRLLWNFLVTFPAKKYKIEYLLKISKYYFFCFFAVINWWFTNIKQYLEIRAWGSIIRRVILWVNISSHGNFCLEIRMTFLWKVPCSGDSKSINISYLYTPCPSSVKPMRSARDSLSARTRVKIQQGDRSFFILCL